MTLLSIVIPAHNEAEAISMVLRSVYPLLERHPCEVIVVDDASGDETPEILRSFPWVKTLRLEKRSGYGAALKAGFRAACGEWIAFFDMDASYDPGDLDALLATALQGKVDIVTGKRSACNRSMSWIRRLGNSCFSSLVSLFYRRQIQDACTGYRLFHSKWRNEFLRLPQKGLNFSLAMTVFALRNNVPFQEKQIRYLPRAGRSKLNVVSDGISFLWVILAGKWVAYGPVE